MEITSLSPSALKRFQRCPANWAFRHSGEKGIVVEETDMLYGKAIHNILALYYQKVPEKPTSEEVGVAIEEAFDEGFTFVMKRRVSTTTKIKENFSEFEKKRLRTWKQFKPTFVEKWLEARVWGDLPAFRVIVDAYWQLDGTGIDWKTGESSAEDNLIQGKINEMVLKHLGYSVQRFYFFSLTANTNLQTPKITDGWIYKLGQRMRDMVAQNRFPRQPSNYCNFCEYILNCELNSRCLWWGL